MSLRLEQLGKARRNKYGHAKSTAYRKWTKNQTARKRRRTPASEKPHAKFSGYAD